MKHYIINLHGPEQLIGCSLESVKKMRDFKKFYAYIDDVEITRYLDVMVADHVLDALHQGHEVEIVNNSRAMFYYE